jgi:hypothetical protein
MMIFLVGEVLIEQNLIQLNCLFFMLFCFCGYSNQLYARKVVHRTWFLSPAKSRPQPSGLVISRRRSLYSRHKLLNSCELPDFEKTTWRLVDSYITTQKPWHRRYLLVEKTPREIFRTPMMTHASVGNGTDIIKIGNELFSLMGILTSLDTNLFE